jgi:diguanylate cyclase (GGDEF)-like protein
MPPVRIIIRTDLRNRAPMFELTPWILPAAVAMLLAGYMAAHLAHSRRAAGRQPEPSPLFRHLVFEQFPDGVVVLDCAGVIIDCNPVSRKSLFPDESDLIGRNINQLLPDEAIVRAGAGRGEGIETMIRSRMYDVRAARLEVPGEVAPRTVLLFRDITERRAAEDALLRVTDDMRRLAHTDALTGLHNRRSFMERLGEEAARVQRHRHPLSLVLFDLDHFKRVNDTHGHETGDRILIAVSEVARQIKRTSDVAGRVGGEEFALLLPETDGPGALRLAERLRAAIEALQVTASRGASVSITTSIGIATVQHAPCHAGHLFSRADQALYQAKRRGRNMVCTAA